MTDGYNGWHDPSRLRVGRHTYGTPQLVIYSAESTGIVSIGNFCSIAAGVRFLVDGEHRSDFITTSPLLGLTSSLPEDHNYSKGNIVVGHDVWIGRDATILSGVSIGTGAVIGACSVVASDIEPYAVAVGNPAKTAHKRFSALECACLLESRWWDLPDEFLRELLPFLRSPDVYAFIGAVEDGQKLTSR